MTTTIIKGRGKGGSNQTRTPVEAPDSIQSIARAKVLIALGEGEFAGGLDAKNIFLGDSSSYTPLQNADGSYNFNNVKYEFRSGTQDQDYIQGFPGIENELQVSYELKQAVPYVRAVSNTQLSALRIRLGWPTLLLQKNNGDKVGTRVEYAIDLSVDGGPYETVVNGAVDDKTTSLYERSHRVNLPKASTGWQLRVRRITPDSTSVNIVDTMRVVAVTEIIDAKLRYVNTALLYVEFDAKQFPNGIPQVVCNPKGRIIRVPDTYDPETRTYSGTWEGVFKWAWTDNPAWIYYDIILNERFGLGQRIDATQIDKWELYRIAQYCDQLVPDGKGGSGTEPRFRCNVYIQDRNDAWNASDVSSVWATSSEVNLTGKVGNPPKPVGFIASDNVVFGIELSWGFPANTDDTLKTEIQYSLTGTEDDAMLLADVPYPQRKYQQMGLKAGQIFWYRAQLVDRSGNESGYTEWVRGQASIDVSDITDVILEEIKYSEVFKDLIESAVESSEKLAELSDAIKENADGLAAAVGSNKQTAEAIIGNALAIADVVVRQTAQQGANSAKFEQLREVIATETEARVTDVTRLEAKTAQNEAGITDVRQALATETEARASAVSQLTAATQAASDKADSAAAVGAQNTASITDLSQVVTDLDSSMASRLEELGAQTDKASGGIQNNAIALITSTLAQVNQRNLLSVQYGDNKAGIERVDNVMADASKAVAESLRTLDSSTGGNTANITDLSKTLADFTQASATQINSLKVTVNGQSAAIVQNSQVSADINNNLNAMYSIKVAVDSNGNQYAAGMGIGVQNTPSGMQTQVIFLADRFAVMTQAGGAVTLPFVIQNGQTIIRDTVIGDGTIGNAKIGSYIQSSTWDGTGNVGWHINKSGYATFNNVTVRGSIYATNGNFSFNGSGNTTVINGNGVTINIPGGGR
ncbi:TPA: DUF1983 domain-containing protein, partial [Enterobacter kobei]